MKVQDVIGDMDDNLDILSSLGALNLDRNFIRAFLEGGKLDRIKRIVSRKGKDKEKIILLEEMLNTKDYVLEGFSYAQEIAEKVPDSLMIEVANELSSYALDKKEVDFLEKSEDLYQRMEDKGAELSSTNYVQIARINYHLGIERKDSGRLDKATRLFKRHGTKTRETKEEFANALLIRGIAQANDSLFEEGLKNYEQERMDSEATAELIEKFNQIEGYIPCLRMGDFLLSSGKENLAEEGIEYFLKAEKEASKVPKDSKKNKDPALKKTILTKLAGYYKQGKISENPKAADLAVRISKELSTNSTEEEKSELANTLLEINEEETKELGTQFIKEIAKPKKSFEEIYDLGTKLSGKDAKELFDTALRFGRGYQNLLKVSEALGWDKKYLDEAKELGKKDELMETGEDLFAKKEYVLAHDFFVEALKQEKNYEEFKRIGKKFSKVNEYILATDIFAQGAQHTKSLEQFVDMLKNANSGSNSKSAGDMVLEGLQKHNKIADYEFALEYLEEEVGIEKTIGAIKVMKKQEMSKGAQELLDKYEVEKKEEAEKERKKKEAEEKKKREEEPHYFGPTITNIGKIVPSAIPDHHARRFPRTNTTQPLKKSTPLIEDRGLEEKVTRSINSNSFEQFEDSSSYTHKIDSSLIKEMKESVNTIIYNLKKNEIIENLGYSDEINKFFKECYQRTSDD